MGMRFHKSIRLLPFLRLNFSKSGISFSLGTPGASLNLGTKGARGSVGIPGTGLSYRKSLSGAGRSSGAGVILRTILLCALFAAAAYIYAVLQR